MVKYRSAWRVWIFWVGLWMVCSCKNEEKAPSPELPNIVIILADDLGYGDLASYNPESLIPTPNLDRLALEGIRLTDAYCPVAVCSPSRYALMTGNYPFRSWNKSGVLANYEPSMMAKGELTLPQMLENTGYTTAGFGKWHLGASFSTLDGKRPAGYGKFKTTENGANLDLGKPIADGPVNHGFEHWYGFSCASECWIMDGQQIVAALQHEFYNIDAASNTEHIEVIPADQYLNRITKKSIQFMQDHVQAENNRPFFLYFSPYVPHVPLAVSKAFQGTTQAGLYGDYVYELDTHIGKLMGTLDSLGLAGNTLVMFATDNGSQFTGTGTHIDLSKAGNDPGEVAVREGEEAVHRPNGRLRGTKWTVWEGGVRTPFIARWPGHIPPNTKSRQLFALNDVMATLAAVIGYDLPADMAVDSYDQLPILEGNDEDIRKAVVVQSSGDRYGIRKGDWKYVEPTGEDAPGELYNLREDISESKNRFDEHSELVRELKEHLDKILQSEASNIGINR